jgi:periplasmic divalent cation tolerance protein
MVICYLTCAHKKEATKISQALLENKLIACARQSQVSSSYWWDGKINHDDEVLLMMESLEDKFDEIEKVVTNLHSYDEYVLTAVPVLKTTPGVHAWLDETLTRKSA